jgi:hypothetical protein
LSAASTRARVTACCLMGASARRSRARHPWARAFFVERGVVECIAHVQRGGCAVIEFTATSSAALT